MSLRTNITTSLQMFDIFMQAYDGQGNITIDAAKQIKGMLEGVNEQDRGFVFTLLLQYLREEGVAFSTEQMQADPTDETPVE